MARWQRVRVNIPKGYKPEERKIIAQEIIDHIVERSREDGLDKNNNKFAPYSKSYKKSLDFKIGGKTSKVDLTLTGEMLDSLKLISHNPDSILIGYDAGDSVNGKAEGNIRGTYGQKKKVAPARDFLGIHKDSLKRILEKYPLDDDRERKDNLQLAAEALAAAKELTDV